LKEVLGLSLLGKPPPESDTYQPRIKVWIQGNFDRADFTPEDRDVDMDDFFPKCIEGGKFEGRLYGLMPNFILNILRLLPSILLSTRAMGSIALSPPEPEQSLN